MTETIAVLGATGNVGRALVDHLAAAGVVPRVSTRDPGAIWRVPVERIVGDIADPAVAARLLTGASGAFVMSTVTATEASELAVIAAAVAAGVRHLVMLSTIGVEADTEIGRRHRVREAAIERAGVAWTFVRPGFFMSNALQWRDGIRAGTVSVPAADAPVLPISPRDIAEVAARALLAPDAHAGKIHTLTGEVPSTAREQIAILARILDRPLTCISLTPDAAAARALSFGLPPPVVRSLQTMWTALESGPPPTPTTTVRDVTGHPPETFETWARDHAALFR